MERILHLFKKKKQIYLLLICLLINFLLLMEIFNVFYALSVTITANYPKGLSNNSPLGTIINNFIPPVSGQINLNFIFNFIGRGLEVIDFIPVLILLSIILIYLIEDKQNIVASYLYGYLMLYFIGHYAILILKMAYQYRPNFENFFLLFGFVCLILTVAKIYYCAVAFYKLKYFKNLEIE